MAKLKKKETEKSDITYVLKKLELVKSQMDKAEAYLKNNPWDEIEDQAKRERELKMQVSLTDSLLNWMDRYMDECGIMDTYNQLEEAKNKRSLRAGQEVSGIQQFVRSKL